MQHDAAGALGCIAALKRKRAVSELPQRVQCLITDRRDCECLIADDQRIADSGIRVVVRRRVQHRELCQLRRCIIVKDDDEVGIRIIQEKKGFLTDARNFAIEFHTACSCLSPYGTETSPLCLFYITTFLTETYFLRGRATNQITAVISCIILYILRLVKESRIK